MTDHYHGLPTGMLTNEPVALASLARVSVTLLATFGLQLSSEQIAAIITFVEVAALVLVHPKVMPKQVAMVQAVGAYNDGYDDAHEEIASLKEST